MRRRRFKLEEKEFSEINITPFTDVILVLLIIFMITSPFLMSGSFKVKLPESTTAESEISQAAEVYLNDANEIFVNNQKITLEELPVFMGVEFSRKGNKDVIVKADKNVKHGTFIQMLDALKKSGAAKLLIAASKINDDKPVQTELK